MKPVSKKEVAKKELVKVLGNMTPTEQAMYRGYKLTKAQQTIKDNSSRAIIKSMMQGESIPMQMADGTHVILTAEEYVAQSYVARLIRKAQEGTIDSDEMIKMQKVLGEDKQVVEIHEKKSFFGEPIDVEG